MTGTARTLSYAKTAIIAVDTRVLFVVVSLLALPLILASGAELLRGP